jgi:hypothetical protein
VFIVDTGASYTITHCLEDFTHPPSKLPSTRIQGIGAGLAVEGAGPAKYILRADDGTLVEIILHHVLYVPACCIRLLCPRQLAITTGHEGDGFFSASSTNHLVCYGHTITVPYHASTGLPVLITAPGITAYTAFYQVALKPSSSPTTTVKFQLAPPASSRVNLTPAHWLILILHERCNHINMGTLNSWIRKGHFLIDPAVARCLDPVCLACQFGKAKRHSHRADVGSITQRHHVPGAGVSADQLEAGCLGRMMTTRGLPAKQHYRYCNLWVDHFTCYIFPIFHVSKDVPEMLGSKKCFEDFAAHFHAPIHSIRADYGAYASQQFQQACASAQQDLKYCVVSGHWQNSVAERHIGVVTQTAHTLLLHVMAHWPGVVTEEFRPFAVCHACTFHNASIRSDTNQSPHRMFMGKEAPWRMDHFRVFVSPVFVLVERLQDGD